jgi:hypothetical protein
MSRRRALRGLLSAVAAVLALAAGAAGVQAADDLGPAPCPGPIGFGCLPAGLPGGLPNPFPTLRPSPVPTPTAQPSLPPAPGPVPAPGPALPTDVGFHALQQQVAAGASWFLPQLFPMLTAPAGDSNWFLELYRRMENIGALLLLLFLVLGLATALIQRDLVLLLKVPFLYLPIAIGVTIAAIQLTQLLMAVVDGFTVYMLQGIGDDLGAALSHASAVLAAAAAGTALTGSMEAAVLLVAGTILLAALGIVLELLARTAAIYVCLAFVPVTVACLLWPKLAQLPKLLVEVLVGLILLKWVVAVVLALAVKAFEANPFTMGPQGDPGFITIVMGAVMLVIAAVGSPLTLIKAIPFVEGQVVGHWSGQARRMVVGAAAMRRIDPKRLQDAVKAPASAAGRISLPVKGSQGQQQPRIMVLPKGAQIFVRSPRPAQASQQAAQPRPTKQARPPRQQPEKPKPPPPGQPWGRPPAKPQPPPTPAGGYASPPGGRS